MIYPYAIVSYYIVLEYPLSAHCRQHSRFSLEALLWTGYNRKDDHFGRHQTSIQANSRPSTFYSNINADAG